MADMQPAIRKQDSEESDPVSVVAAIMSGEIDSLVARSGQQRHSEIRQETWYFRILRHYGHALAANVDALMWLGHSREESMVIARTLIPFLVMNLDEKHYRDLLSAGVLDANDP